MNVSRVIRPTWIVPAVWLAAVAPTVADSIFLSHYDEVDPTTEGWDSYVGTATTVVPVTDDRGGEAWRITDPGGMDDSVAVYFKSIPTETLDQMMTHGWTMRACIRIADDSGLGQQSIFFGLNTTVRRFDMWFSDVGFAPVDIVTLMASLGDCIIAGPTTFSSGESQCGTEGFHLFELVYDPTTQTADLYIDGLLQIEDYPGHTIGLNQTGGISWGAGSTCGDGVGDFRLIELVVNTPDDPDPIPGDLNNDQIVDGADLGILLSLWESADEIADLNDDGTVDGADLGILLSNWSG
jgi:hypothetical protein